MPYRAEEFGGALTGPVAPINAPAPPSPTYPERQPFFESHPGTEDLVNRITQPRTPTWSAPGSADLISQVTGGTVPSVGPTKANQSYSFDSDPGVAMARALENQGIGQLDAWLKSAREQAIIQAGDPALASMAGFGLDPQAGVFAQQNYLSGNADLARVKRAKDLARQAIVNKLAARGILRSGDLGYLEGQSNIDFGNQEYDVRQGVLNKLSNLMSQYLAQKQGLSQSTLNAYQQAYQNYAQNPDLLAALGGTPNAPAATTPAASAAQTIRDLLRWQR